MKKIIALILCITTAATLSACTPANIFSGLNSAIRNVLEPPSSSGREDTRFESAELEATYTDITAFTAKCSRMKELYDAGDTAGAFAMYDKLYTELIETAEASQIAFVKLSKNVNDRALIYEEQKASDDLQRATDTFCAVCHEMITGTSAQAFRSHLSDDFLTGYYEEYRKKSEEELELFNKENELQQEYNSLLSALYNTSCEIDGKTYTLDDAIGDNARIEVQLDVNLYTDIIEKCMASFGEKAGQIFKELVSVRTLIAQMNGYDNYADYADDVIYERNYSDKDLEQMKSEVRAVAAKYRERANGRREAVSTGGFDLDEMLNNGRDIASAISPVAGDAITYLISNGLASIGADEGRESGAYTIYLSSSQIPFIYAEASGNSEDYVTLFHELGHFTAFHNVKPPYPVFVEGDLDLMETHSQALQLLFNKYSGRVFGRDAAAFNKANLTDVADVVVEGCELDDWQRAVYKNPDMTLDEINSLYRDICLEYGETPYPSMEYSWCIYSHNFTSPMYYISYAISAFAALQIWEESLDDYPHAVKLWEDLIAAGAYKYDYKSVMEQVGLEDFDEKGVISDIFEEVIGYLNDDAPVRF